MLEKNQCRNSSHIEARRNRWVVVHIDLVYLGTTRKFFRSSFDRRRHCAAGTAPGRPKIHEDWLIRLQQLIVEPGFVYIVYISVHNPPFERALYEFQDRLRIMASSLAIVAKAVLLIFRIPPLLPTASATGIPIVKSLKSVRCDATSQLRSQHTSRNRERIREIHVWTTRPVVEASQCGPVCMERKRFPASMKIGAYA